jgi:hypothetical protein
VPFARNSGQTTAVCDSFPTVLCTQLSLPCCITNYRNMACPPIVEGGDGLRIQTVGGSMLNKKSRSVYTVWHFSLGLVVGLITLRRGSRASYGMPSKASNFDKCCDAI